MKNNFILVSRYKNHNYNRATNYIMHKPHTTGTAATTTTATMAANNTATMAATTTTDLSLTTLSLKQAQELQLNFQTYSFFGSKQNFKYDCKMSTVASFNCHTKHKSV